jgi:EDD domain protein, DegV family
MNKKFILSCCSTSDLTLNDYKERNIEHIAFHYYVNDKEYLDDNFTSLSANDFYTQMKNGAKTRTSQVSVGEFVEYFEKFLKEGLDILHVTLSGGISGVINSATTARDLLSEKYPERKIYVVDSLSGSTGYGLLMLKLADLRDAGKDIDEVKNEVENLRFTIQHLLFTPNLSYFFSGGRIPKAVGFITNILHFCPVIEANINGKMVLKKKTIGKKHALNGLLELLANTIKDGTNYNDYLFIGHSNIDLEVESLKNTLSERYPNVKDKMRIFSIGTTMGSHCGPGTLLVTFIGDKRS